MTGTWILLLLACTTPEKNDSTRDTAETAVPPVDDEDPWGVLSLNLHCLKIEGTTFADTSSRMAAIAAEVAGQDIVALALQEVCRNEAEDAGSMLESALEDATGDTWTGTFLLAHTAWEGTADEALESVGILARGSLADISETTFRHQGAMNRVLLGAALDNGVRLYTVHLDVDDSAVRSEQAREIATEALVATDPDFDVLIGGDFNDSSRSGAVWALTATGFVEDTSAQDDERDHILRHTSADLSPVRSSYLFDDVEGPVVSDHKGLASWYGAGSGETPCITHVDFRAEVDTGHFVAVRGSKPPLDWSYGLPAWDLGDGTWRWTATVIPEGEWEIKALLDDATWQDGENAGFAGCGDTTVDAIWEAAP